MACYGAVKGTVVARRSWSIVRFGTATFEAKKAAWDTRTERLWLGLIAVPLAEVATGLLAVWWAWLLLLAVAWILLPSSRWLWVMALELGFVGLVWATAGISLLQLYPGSRLAVGVVWIAFPLALAGSSLWSRRRANWPEP